jgi:hypothetical protein
MNTITPPIQKLSGRAQSAIISFTIFAMWATTGAYPGLAQQSAQQTFPSAAEASQTLFKAVQHNNVRAIANILGGPTELASCGDQVQDNAERELFVQKYQQMHRLGREADSSVTLYLGAENWPFPISLVESNGVWHFDPDAGLKEVLFRRIGENELAAITICREFVTAEKQHSPQSKPANATDSFPASLVARAASESSGGDPVLLQGYYFHVLATHATDGSRARTALIAYPAAYRSSGVMTFIVTNNGVVYEKDLGANTSALSSAMTTFHRDPTWQPADE